MESTGCFPGKAPRSTRFSTFSPAERWRASPAAGPSQSKAPGLYCISATLLNQVYAPFPPLWSEARETQYWRLREKIASLRPDHPASADGQPDAGETARLFARYDYLHFNRLCVSLRLREPDAMIGYLILIYRLSAEDLADYLDVPVARSAGPR